MLTVVCKLDIKGRSTLYRSKTCFEGHVSAIRRRSEGSKETVSQEMRRFYYYLRIIFNKWTMRHCFLLVHVFSPLESFVSTYHITGAACYKNQKNRKIHQIKKNSTMHGPHVVKVYFIKLLSRFVRVDFVQTALVASRLTHARFFHGSDSTFAFAQHFIQ